MAWRYPIPCPTRIKLWGPPFILRRGIAGSGPSSDGQISKDCQFSRMVVGFRLPRHIWFIKARDRDNDIMPLSVHFHSDPLQRRQRTIFCSYWTAWESMDSLTAIHGHDILYTLRSQSEGAPISNSSNCHCDAQRKTSGDGQYGSVYLQQ